MNLIDINLGDWSSDGHGRTESNYFECSHSLKEIVSAYNKGCKKLGFTPHKEIAQNYEDSSISEECYNKFLEKGLDFTIEELQYLEPRHLAGLFIFTVKLGNSKIEFVPAVNDVKEVFGYGGITDNFGYGLFQ